VMEAAEATRSSRRNVLECIIDFMMAHNQK
jgi:hypothetical protein